MKDYYLVLGVSRSETPSGIRSAFRDLVRRHHPDVAGPDSTRAFREIVEAYETLSDPEARRGHDEALRASARAIPVRRAPPARSRATSLFAHPETVEPSLDELFERWLRNFTGRGVPKSERAEPLVCDVRLSDAEARRGGVLPVRIPLLAPCPSCHGSGASAFFPCPACGTSGWRTREAVVELSFPPGVRSGTAFDVSLARLGVANLWLHVRVRVGAA